MNLDYDVIAWAHDRFSKPLEHYKLEKPKAVYFTLDPSIKKKIASFKKEFEHLDDLGFHYNSFDNIQPRSHLLYTLSYQQ